MKLSLFSLTLMVGAALSAATPDGYKKGPPGPPKGSYGSVSQTCSVKQSSLHCCRANGNKVNVDKGKGNSKHVSWKDGNDLLFCSQIVDDDYNKAVQSICSTTVACCIGDGCIAIAN